MNMREPTTAWDRPASGDELVQFHGEDKPHRVRDEIIETLTKTILTTSHARLCVPYVENQNGIDKIAVISVAEVVQDYGTDKGPCLTAFMEILEASKCPLVAEYRMALAKRYSEAWADEVEEVTA